MAAPSYFETIWQLAKGRTLYKLLSLAGPCPQWLSEHTYKTIVDLAQKNDREKALVTWQEAEKQSMERLPAALVSPPTQTPTAPPPTPLKITSSPQDPGSRPNLSSSSLALPTLHRANSTSTPTLLSSCTLLVHVKTDLPFADLLCESFEAETVQELNKHKLKTWKDVTVLREGNRFLATEQELVRLCPLTWNSQRHAQLLSMLRSELKVDGLHTPLTEEQLGRPLPDLPASSPTRTVVRTAEEVLKAFLRKWVTGAAFNVTTSDSEAKRLHFEGAELFPDIKLEALKVGDRGSETEKFPVRSVSPLGCACSPPSLIAIRLAAHTWHKGQRCRSICTGQATRSPLLRVGR